jgi:hypothetical protein
VTVTKIILRNFRATTYISWYQTIRSYFKNFVHLQSIRYLPKRREQLLQHQLEINFKYNSVNINENSIKI